MKKLFSLLILVLIFQGIMAQMYIRYNQAGYFPSQAKRIIVMSNTNIQGTAWKFVNNSGEIVLQGEILSSLQGVTSYTTKQYNYVVDFTELDIQGIYNFSIGTDSPIHIKITGTPYDAFTKDVLLGLRARRSASHDSRVHAYSHAGDTSCFIFERQSSSNSNWKQRADNKKANMLGGWYDAGDYIKFTLTTAYTTYFLLKAYENNPSLFINEKEFSTTNLNDLLDEAQVGLDYLMKTMPESGIFIIQTGGSKDHEQSMRLPENDLLDGKRECYSALSKPQMGYTAAALALGASVFEQAGFSTKALEYKNKAIEIYAAAKLTTETNAWFESAEEVYYCDLSEFDNMELAAIELFRLTNNQDYLTDAKIFGESADQSYWYSWGDINPFVHSLVLPEYAAIETPLIGDLQEFTRIRNLANNIWKAPHSSTWGTLYSYFGVANAALMYQQSSQKDTYKSMALDVLHYTFGINPWGLAFVASQDLPKSITSTYAILYRLQPDIFPRGEIAEGPTTLDEHTANKTYFSPAHNSNLWHKEFNSPELTFFEQPGDYVCMETTITGLADGLFLMATASAMFNEEISNSIPKDKEIEVRIVQDQSLVTFSMNTIPQNNCSVTIYNVLGNEVFSKQYKDTHQISSQVQLIKGMYEMIVISNNQRNVVKFVVD